MLSRDDTFADSLERGSQTGALSADGRFVAIGHVSDLYRFEIATQTLQRLTGDNPAGDSIGEPSISADGNRIALRTGRQDLTGSADRQIVLFDLAAGTVTLVSHTPAGQPSSGQVDQWHAISDDGSTVAFTSSAGDLVAGSGGGTHLYAYDVATGVITQVDVTPTGESISSSVSDRSSISGDGRLVAFTARNPGLIGGTEPLNDSLFVRDLDAGTTRLIVEAPDGQGFAAPSISGDGRRVAMIQSGPNFEPEQIVLVDV